MKLQRAALWAGVVLSAAVWAAAEGDFSDVLTQTEVAQKVAENPELKKLDQDVRQRSDQREQQRQRAGAPADRRAADEPLDDGAADQVMARLPNAPAYLEDLKRERAEELGQLAEENIWGAAEVKATPDSRKLYRDYLRQVYFYGNGGTALGARIRRALERPRGFGDFPTMAHGAVPPNALATWSGGHITIGPGGDSMVVVSHEFWHDMDNWLNGKMDGEEYGEPERYAYAMMGREFS